MKKILTIVLAIALTSLNLAAQEARHGDGQPLTAKRLAEIQATRTRMIKASLQLTPEQEPVFDKEFSNYVNIIMASLTNEFQNRPRTRPDNPDEAIETIYRTIDSQLVQLAAKKQLFDHLKDCLDGKQLMTLHRFTGLRDYGKRAKAKKTPKRDSELSRLIERYHLNGKALRVHDGVIDFTGEDGKAYRIDADGELQLITQQ